MNSNMSLEIKILLSKVIIKLIWISRIEPRGCTNAPWHVCNHPLHIDMNIPSIEYFMKEDSIRHHDKLENDYNDSICIVGWTAAQEEPWKVLTRRVKED